jgi:hypothetical protein
MYRYIQCGNQRTYLSFVQMEEDIYFFTFSGKKEEKLGFGLPTPSERRRVEYIFILAVICVPIGENFEVFGLIESRERTAF